MVKLMQDYLKQAYFALVAYFERGEKALAYIQSGKTNRFERMMNRRKAAYHNFRAAEAILADQGIHVHDQDELAKLWVKAKQVDDGIIEVLSEMKLRIQGELGHVNNAKNGISKYRSGKNIRSALIQAV